MKNLQYFQYIIMIILLLLGIYLGYTLHKPKVTKDCSQEINKIMIQYDSAIYVIGILRDSLDKKIQYDTIFVTKKYTEKLNNIRLLPVDSSIKFLSSRISFMDGD